MLTALIIDDETPSRDELRALLEQSPDIEIVGECANAIEGLAAIHRLRPDVVFLDIQMPRVSGLEMVPMIDPGALPRIVFVTAHDEHALQAFEEHAVDYLLKPIEAQRLQRTLDWLRAGGQPGQRQTETSRASLTRIPCCGHNRIFLISVDEVEYIHTDLSGVRVIGIGQQGMTELTLKTLQEKTSLIRCHRQYLVNPDRIQEIALQENGAAEIVTHGNRRIPVSRRHLRELKEFLMIP